MALTKEEKAKIIESLGAAGQITSAVLDTALLKLKRLLKEAGVIEKLEPWAVHQYLALVCIINGFGAMAKAKGEQERPGPDELMMLAKELLTILASETVTNELLPLLTDRLLAAKKESQEAEAPAPGVIGVEDLERWFKGWDPKEIH